MNIAKIHHSSIDQMHHPDHNRRMFIQILVLALLSPNVQASARNEAIRCVTLLNPAATAAEESFLLPPDAVELTNAQQWLRDHGDQKPTDEAAKNIYSQWRNWNSVTSARRKAVLALELQMISSPAKENVFTWDGSARLKALSRVNLERMLRKIHELHPAMASASADAEIQKDAAAMSRQVRISYSRPPVFQRDEGIHPPIPSARELVKQKLSSADGSFHSWLLGNSPSVEFEASLVSGRARMPSALHLRDEFAAAEGFVLPLFNNVEELLTFFEVWDPSALDRVVMYNRMSLPNKINSGETLMAKLRSGEMMVDEIFPSTQPERLAALREKLSDFVMTDKDAREFIQRAFELYALSRAGENEREFRRFKTDLNGALGPQNIFLRGFMAFAGLPGLTLHVPVSVPAQAYSIVRDQPLTTSMTFDRFKRRLDHDSKP